MWFRSKYQALAEDLATQLAEIRGEHQVELHRRVSAEAIAEERAQEIERLYVLLAEANKERKDANADRLKSLDLVNTALLGQHGPEKPPQDIKQYTQVNKRTVHASTLARQADQAFIKKFIYKDKPKPPEPPVQ